MVYSFAIPIPDHCDEATKRQIQSVNEQLAAFPGPVYSNNSNNILLTKLIANFGVTFFEKLVNWPQVALSFLGREYTYCSYDLINKNLQDQKIKELLKGVFKSLEDEVSRNSTLQEAQAALTKTNSQLEHDKSQLVITNESLEKEKKELTLDYEQLKREKIDLISNCKKLEKERDDNAASCEKLKEDNQNLSDSNIILETENSDLKISYDQLIRERDILIKKTGEISLKDKKIKQIQKQFLHLQHQLVEKQAELHQLSNINSLQEQKLLKQASRQAVCEATTNKTIKVLKEEHMHQKRLLQESAKAENCLLQAQIEGLKSNNLDLENQINSLRSNNEKLNAQIEKLNSENVEQKRASAAQAEQMQSQVSEMHKQMHKRDLQIEAIQAQMSLMMRIQEKSLAQVSKDVHQGIHAVQQHVSMIALTAEETAINSSNAIGEIRELSHQMHSSFDRNAAASDFEMVGKPE